MRRHFRLRKNNGAVVHRWNIFGICGLLALRWNVRPDRSHDVGWFLEFRDLSFRKDSGLRSVGYGLGVDFAIV